MHSGRQVVAHRGSSAAHAEHTLAAYELALEEGADALECDVRLTRDGVLVCVHDRRVDRVSDGRGVVSTLELAELAELDFASWKARQGDPLLEAAWEEADLDPERRGVLTLERLLQLALDRRTPAAGRSSCTSRPSTPPGTAAWWSGPSSTCSTATAWPRRCPARCRG